MREHKNKSFQFELVGAGQQTLFQKQIQYQKEYSNVNKNNDQNIMKAPQKNKSYIRRLRKQFAENEFKLRVGCKQSQNLSVDQIQHTEDKYFWPKLICKPSNYEQKRLKSQPIELDGFCFLQMRNTEEKNEIPLKLRFPQINDKNYHLTQITKKQRENLNFNKIMHPRSIYMQGKAIK